MNRRIIKDDIDKFIDYDIYVPTRTIFMGSADFSLEHGESGTDGAMAERMIKALHILDNSAPSGDKPITIIMNNIGGEEYHGFAIYDAIKACKNHITIQVMGHAMSMGSIILQAADKRVMSPTSRQMIHYGTWGNHDHAKTHRQHSNEGERINSWMEKTYLFRIQQKHKKFKLEKLQKMLMFDTYLTAEESVKIGLADEVMVMPPADAHSPKGEDDANG
jgi:ATP-dependent Clp endopeptidase proteolytic subunit ClpP